jgi:hypothetical protein
MTLAFRDNGFQLMIFKQNLAFSYKAIATGAFGHGHGAIQITCQNERTDDKSVTIQWNAFRINCKIYIALSHRKYH